MDSSEANTCASSNPAISTSPVSASSPSSLGVSSRVILSPCAACKILRRRCAEKCVLAPYFPPTDPEKFSIAHRVFGASNIIKFLLELPESQRDDAVSSMVYEARARIRNPVYGSAGPIFHLQKQVNELRAELAKAQAKLLNMEYQQTNLVSLICREFSESSESQTWPNHLHHLQSPDDFILNDPHYSLKNNTGFFDDGSMWEPLWT